MVLKREKKKRKGALIETDDANLRYQTTDIFVGCESSQYIMPTLLTLGWK